MVCCNDCTGLITGTEGVIVGTLVGIALLNTGEPPDLWRGWSPTADLRVELALATVVCCGGCTGLDTGTEGITAGTVVETALLNTGESSGTSSTVTFGRGLAGGAEDCDEKKGMDPTIP